MPVRRSDGMRRFTGQVITTAFHFHPQGDLKNEETTALHRINRLGLGWLL